MPNRSELKERLAKLTAAQRSLLANQLIGGSDGTAASNGSAAAVTKTPPLRVVKEWNGDGIHQERSYYPASPSQQRMWFLQQYAPESPVYNVPSAYRLYGPLNVAWLEAAFENVIRRHDSLRTSFNLENGGLCQRVAAHSSFRLQQVNLEATLEDVQLSAAQRCLQDTACLPFNLTAETPFRAVLVRLGPQDHLLFVVWHHIISDGWSRSILWRELSDLYEAQALGRSTPLPNLRCQFTDYTAWQQERWDAGALDGQAAYWKSKLAGELRSLELPSDRPRPNVQSLNGRRCTSRLDPDLIASLKQRAQEEGATLFMILLAAFKAILYRYTGCDDIVVGVPIAGRSRVEAEGLIGFFVNTLVLRTTFSGNPSFRELLRRVKATTVEALAHQEMPFDQLVQLLQVKRDLSRTPLFQIAFALHDYPDEALRLEGIHVEPCSVDTQTAKFDLSLSVERTDSGWQATAEYNCDLFDADRMERMLEHWRILLAGIVADAGQRIGALPLLTHSERQQLLVEWNDTVVGDGDDTCETTLAELIEAQAARTPDALAVVCQGAELSYRELNTRANQLAHHLRALGVGPDVLVGICLERSLEMVVGMLGILKAGGAYVPLDPAYPKKRIAFMLTDSQAPILLTQQKLAASLPPQSSRIVCLDADWPQIAAAPEINVASPASPASLAYLIYTSGSTGQPKGVAIEHRNVVTFIKWAQSLFTVEELSDVLGSTSVCFDLSVFELFVTLSSGGRVILIENAIGLLSRSPAANPSLINTAPSAMAELLRLNAVPDSVVTVNLAGEALSTELVNRIYQHTKVKRVFDLYGPSETTTYSTYALRLPELPATIGRPIANTQVYVLDAHGNLVPIGVPGELYIGGDGLARGYLNRPELTAEKFVPDPFSTRPGARMYRTGDQVRWRADGNLEFLGRLDHQVKLRGFRIELGEIEAVLSEHAQVRQAVVLLREDHPGDKRLAAYLVPQSADAPPSATDLRRHLGARLPDYMVPAAFVFLDALPLTPNGKVDRKALQAPDESRPDLEADYVAPRNGTEESMARIWCEIIGIKRVGVHDNFFALGGHSLLATRVHARITSELQTDLPLRQLFAVLTIAELASAIEAMRHKEPSLPSVPLQRRERQQLERLPLSFAQERLWFLDQLEGGSATYNICWALRLQGRLNRTALMHSLEAIVRRHEALRTTYVKVDGVPQAVVNEPAAFPLTVTDLQGLAEADRETQARQLASEEAGQPFDLARDLMLRARLLQLGEQDQVLVLLLHHIASDGWSAGVFCRELTSLYTAFDQDQPSPLSELPLQYQDYAIWQRQWLDGTVLAGQLAYWKQQLAGAPALLELPTDFPRPALASHRGARQAVVLDTELTQALLALCRREAVTPFMLLLAAWQVLLSRYSGQEDISVGAPIAGRNRTELEGLIGCFVNTLVLRTNLSGNPPFRKLLARVREVTLGAYAHQDLPFEKLVEELHPERCRGHSPLFQVLLVLQHAAEGLLELPGVTASHFATDNATAKFDLTLSLGEQDGQLQGTLEYRTDLFQTATIVRLIGHFQTLLAGIVADAGQRIGALPLLSESERQQLLVEWNDTATDYPRDQCLHQLFEAQVQRTPEAVAVVFQDQRLTYRELNARANQLAHYLRHLGVTPEALIGLCLDRSPEMIIAILGILKAGGAYVPLTADYPLQRLKFICEDATIRFLVTTAARRERLPTSAVQVVCLDGDSPLWKSEAYQNPTAETRPDHLAYVIYTSGSTGLPKGVETPHRGVVRLLFGADYGRLDKSRTFLQLSTIAFDASTFEIWGALLHGARCVLFPPEVPTASGLRRIVEQSQVDTLWLTAALFNSIMDEDPLALAGIRQLLIGGEALSVPHVQVALDHLPSTDIINGYGPTESTTFACCFRIPRSLADRPSSIPIGRPIANTQVYVLDPHGNPVPIGVPGELFIGGDGLARGYLNRPELTTERFVPDPFSMQQGARLYRTGDRCRYLPDGNLEFLGRLDDQVKLRGFRIELGEIEAALLEHPQVRQAVVLLREDHPGDKRLAAYLVPQSADAPPSATDLRRHLSARLPDYMVPSAFVFLDALPLTPNGKVDRKALQAPDESRPDLETNYVAPRNAIEESMARIWCELLGIKQVGVHDNYFDLGGHSLLGVQVIERINRQFKAALKIADLFRLPTIGQLGGLLAGPEPEPPRDEFLSVLRPSTQRGSVVWIGGHITGLLKSLPPTIGIYHLGLDGMDTDVFHRFDIDATVDCYANELLRARPSGPLIIAGFSYSGLLAYALALRLRSVGQNRVAAVLLEPSIPKSFEIRQPPSLLDRIGRYWRKVFREGPVVLYQSIRYRLEHYRAEPPSHLNAQTAKQWAMCLPHYLRNIATYKPPQAMPEGVHLVASTGWLAAHLDLFQAQLSETPQVCHVSDVQHLDLPNHEDCIVAWIKLINDILDSP